METPNRKVVKRYFEGRKQTWPMVLMVLGVLTIALGIGLLLLAGGFAWYLYNKFAADHEGESEVDRAKAIEMACAKERALKKLNILEDQICDVEPVVVSGRGYEPETSVVERLNIFKKVLKALKINVKSKFDGIEEDPIQRARIGSDSKYRCSLVSVSVFMFGETQLYIYYANVDLCTGLIYSEGTHEYFYSDINAISFLQEKEKIYNFKKRRFQRILFESIKIFANGVHHTATLSTDLDNSVVENQFTGMRNLIRERKNAK